MEFYIPNKRILLGNGSPRSILNSTMRDIPLQWCIGEDPDLVDIVSLAAKRGIQDLPIALMYADPKYCVFNEEIYQPDARAYLHRPVAEAYISAFHEMLHHWDILMVLRDGFRPWQVSVAMYYALEGRPEQYYFADVTKHPSMHNRGCAIDVSFVDPETGREIPMSSAVDELSEDATTVRALSQLTAGSKRNQYVLQQAQKVLTVYGFRPISSEWWHFNFVIKPLPNPSNEPLVLP